MENLNTIGIDTAKNLFAVHINDAKGNRIFRKEIKRAQLLSFLALQPKSIVGIEACSGSHYWGREIRSLGHEVRILPPQHVTAYRPSHKNDFNDAEAIAEAVTRPKLKTKCVPIKEVWQQDIQSLHRIRIRLMKQQTAIVNEVRGLLAEYGVIIPEGINRVRALLPEIAQGRLDERLTPILKKAMTELHKELLETTEKIEKIDAMLEKICRENELCQYLDEIEGIGPLTATALLASGDASAYENGRKYSAHFGLTPRHTQTGGQEAQMQGISKKGDGYIRYLLIQGAMALVRATQRAMKSTTNESTEKMAAENIKRSRPAKERLAPVRAQQKIKSSVKSQKSLQRRQWLERLIKERGPQKAAVAMANKNARIAWAVLTRKERFDLEKAYKKSA